MRMSDQERLELNELCSALVDGVISDAQRQRLAQLLQASPEARRIYVRALALSASLFDYASEMQTEAPEVIRAPTSRLRPRAGWWWAGSLAAAASIVIAFWLGGLTQSGDIAATEPPEIVAHLSGAKDCRWSGAALLLGAGLPSGQRVELASGFAEISFDSGAQIVLEGPASLTVSSAWEAALRHGALKATVPPEAIGFRVGNAAVDVVDLGTEFSMVSEAGGATEVFVLKGAVEAKPRSAPNEPSRSSLVLREKQSRRFARTGISEVRDNDQKFQRLARKLALDRSVRPASFVHWSFDETTGERVHAERGGQPASEFDARLEASPTHALANARIEGRWQSALNCDGRLWAQAHLPDFARRAPRTVAFWVKVPSDASLDTSEAMLAWPLASTNESLEFVWNRAPAQGAFGALRTSVGRGFLVGTTPLRDGRWHHIAIVFASPPHAPQRIQIKQYVDGRLDRVSARHFGKRMTQSAPDHRKVSPGDSEPLWIGRSPNAPSHQGFHGAIDELFLVDRALSQREIRLLMMQNRLPTVETLAKN